MSATVIPLQSARPAPPPTPAHVLSNEHRASLLLTMARSWNQMVQMLADSGLGRDAAEDMVQVLARPLVHPKARTAAGAFLLPELRRLVTVADALQAGDDAFRDAGCDTLAEAIEDAQRDLDGATWLLLTGVELRLACRGCRDRVPVHAWRVQGDCPVHRPGILR